MIHSTTQHTSADGSEPHVQQRSQSIEDSNMRCTFVVVSQHAAVTKIAKLSMSTTLLCFHSVAGDACMLKVHLLR